MITTVDQMPRRDTRGALLGTITAATVCLVGLLFVVRRYVTSITSFDVWGGLVATTVLTALCSLLLLRLARKDPDPRLGMILVGAFVIKQLGTFLRYYVVVYVLGGDALDYHNAGAALAGPIRHFDFGAPAFEEFAPDSISGTVFIRLVTGTVYAVIGTSRLAGFVVFSTLGFWGLYLAFRAFRIAVPEGNHRKLALLLFLTPTLIFWPSSTGKDSWLLFAIGLTVYGAARLFTHESFGIPLLALGLLASALVRPHLTVLLLAGLVLGRALGRVSRRTDRGVVRRVLGKAVLIGFLVGAVALTAGRASTFFNVDELGADSVTAILDETQRRSSQGDSAFEPPRVTSPVGFPLAFITVLYRPFPNEAHNAQQIFSALETTVLLGITLASWRSLVRLPRFMRRYPLISFAVVFVLLFVVAFSAVGNFGILARQRTQVLPMLFMLLALPAVRRKKKRNHGDLVTVPARPPQPVGARFGPPVMAIAPGPGDRA
jgi:hypothetical protein